MLCFRCVLCYQLLTFTLMFSGSITPVVVQVRHDCVLGSSSVSGTSSLGVCLCQVDTDLTFSALRKDTFDGQVTKDLILEDTLHFLLTTHPHLSSETEGRQVRQYVTV